MSTIGTIAGLNNRGTYSAATTYGINDVVQYSNSTYVATAVTKGNLPTNTAYWSLIALGLASGGTTGQLLTKTSNAEGAVGWAAAPPPLTPVTIYATPASPAVAGSYVNADAAAGEVVVTLPTGPPVGSQIGIRKIDASTNRVTISGAGATYDATSPWHLTEQHTSVVVMWAGAAPGWVQLGGSGLVRYRGAFSPGLFYGFGDWVLAAGNLYRCIATSGTSSTTSPNVSAQWTAMTSGTRWRGAWATTTTYYRDDLVTLTNQTYVCTAVQSIGQSPATSADWTLVAGSSATGGGGGGLKPTAVRTAATATDPVSAGDLVLANALTGGFTVTLPANPTAGMTVGVKKIDTSANTVTVVGYGAATIDTDPNALLSSQDAAATFVSDGTNWQIASTALLNTSTSGYPQQPLPTTLASNYWFERRSFTGGAPSAQAVPVTASTIYYTSFFLPAPMSANSVAVGTGTTAPSPGASVRIGVFSCTAAGAPGVLLADLGLLSLGTTAQTGLPMALAPTVALPAGWFYVALSYNGTAPNTAAGYTVSSGLPGPPFGVRSGLGLAWSTMFAQALPGATHYTQTGDATAAAFGTVGVTTAAATAVYGASTQMLPVVYFRSV